MLFTTSLRRFKKKSNNYNLLIEKEKSFSRNLERKNSSESTRKRKYIGYCNIIGCYCNYAREG